MNFLQIFFLILASNCATLTAAGQYNRKKLQKLSKATAKEKDSSREIAVNDGYEAGTLEQQLKSAIQTQRILVIAGLINKHHRAAHGQNSDGRLGLEVSRADKDTIEYLIRGVNIDLDSRSDEVYLHDEKRDVGMPMQIEQDLSHEEAMRIEKFATEKAIAEKASNQPTT